MNSDLQKSVVHNPQPSKKTQRSFFCVGIRVAFISLLFLTSFITLRAQQFSVIVGTFAEETGAKKFAGYVRSKLYNADYELDSLKKYYYVYVLKTNDHEAALTETNRIKEETEFKDVWVLSNKADQIEEEKLAEIKAAEVLNIILPSNPIQQDSILTSSSKEKKPKGRLFKFIIQTEDGKIINNEIHEINFKRGHHLATYKSDEYINLLQPAKDNNPMILVCGIFGYKEVIKELDYNYPFLVEDAKKDDKGAWVIPYQLERMKTGDVSVMYQVSFYKDATIMLHTSKPELDELVNMMKDNPNYKIKIHGHCNGNYSRKIIIAGKPKNYFDVKGTVVRQGSAKELSKWRAEVIERYLTDNGIESSRMSIYAWGSLEMLVPENSTSSKLNDRIEIEIIED